MKISAAELYELTLPLKEPFAISVLSTEAFDHDGFRRLEDLGVTHAQCVPWYFYGGDPDALETRSDAMLKFGDEVIRRFGT